MEIHIITPEGKEEHDWIMEVSIPTTSWIITVRPWHIHLTTILVKWKIIWHDNVLVNDLESYKDQSKHLFISWWVALFADESLTIITSSNTK